MTVKYFAVPYSSDETATAFFFKDKLIEASLEQENMTHEQILRIFELCEEKIPEGWENDTDALIACVMNPYAEINGREIDIFCYNFDKMAIISIDALEDIVEAYDNTFGDGTFCSDSECYEACDMFHETCISYAEKIINVESNAEVKEL